MHTLDLELLTPREKFQRYADLLLHWNLKINLTAITEPNKIQELHFLDSLALLPLLDRKIQSVSQNVSRETFLSVSVLDIGAGAGFPGLPLKITRPDISLTLVDSVKKKCDFMKEVVRTLKLKDVQVLHERIEAKTQMGLFDLVVSRAAFSMSDLIHLSVNQLKPDGWMVGMKSLNIDVEISQARELAASLEMIVEQERYHLPSGLERQLVIMKRK